MSSKRNVLASASVVGLTLLGVAAAFERTSDLGPTFAPRTPPPAPTPSPAPPPSPAPAPTSLSNRAMTGINLTGLNVYSNQRAFMNLVASGYWFQVGGAKGWVAMPDDRLTPARFVKSLAPGEVSTISVNRIFGAPGVHKIRCTWAGTGKMGQPGGYLKYAGETANSLDLTMTTTTNVTEGGWIALTQTSPADPLRDLDCREIDASKTTTFTPGFLDEVRQFSAVRFLDWQSTNNNGGGQWDRMAAPGRKLMTGPEGATVEAMVAVANEADVDPWFLMPYKADDRYIEEFAKYVHANLEPGRVAHVELGNEVWNYAFGVTHLALQEGKAAGLHSGSHEAMLLRYAQKTTHAMKIWTRVFADDPRRLVRIIATQNAGGYGPRLLLGYQDTANWVDGLATAPYFEGPNLAGKTAADLDAIFTEANIQIGQTLGRAVEAKAVATSFGKKYFAYEGGQHLNASGNVSLLMLANRDPRMGTAYARYMREWKERLGGRIMLFQSTGPISQYGAWGIREYQGQPLSEAPKLRAVFEFLQAG